MKKFISLLMMLFLFLGVSINASAHNKYYKDEKKALKEHQKYEKNKLKARQEKEKERA